MLMANTEIITHHYLILLCTECFYQLEVRAQYRISFKKKSKYLKVLDLTITICLTSW